MISFSYDIFDENIEFKSSTCELKSELFISIVKTGCVMKEKIFFTMIIILSLELIKINVIAAKNQKIQNIFTHEFLIKALKNSLSMLISNIRQFSDI
jgi:hypothetical protein